MNICEVMEISCNIHIEPMRGGGEHRRSSGEGLEKQRAVLERLTERADRKFVLVPATE